MLDLCSLCISSISYETCFFGYCTFFIVYLCHSPVFRIVSHIFSLRHQVLNYITNFLRDLLQLWLWNIFSASLNDIYCWKGFDNSFEEELRGLWNIISICRKSEIFKFPVDSTIPKFQTLWTNFDGLIFQSSSVV